MMKNTRSIFGTVAALAVSVGASHAATIFADDFSGGTGDINGLAPDTRPGSETWVATDFFNADGSVNPTGTTSTGGSATLAFAPQQGTIYQFDSSISLTVSGSGAWLGFGFADGQNTAAAAGNRFLTGDTIGRAWGFFRMNTNNPAAAMDGVDNNSVWNGDWYADLTGALEIDFRVILDTTGGAGNWTATWYAKQGADPNYLLARAETGVDTESISSVGFAVSGTGWDGNIESFSLSQVPEPTSALFGAFGSLLFLRRRR